MGESDRNGKPDPGVVKEGGYRPTVDPGPVPTSLVREAPDPQSLDELLTQVEEAKQNLVKSLAHEIRVEILTVLSEREASPNELAKELREGLSQVSYHFGVLKDYEIIEVARTVPRRGAVEHYYRLNQAWHARVRKRKALTALALMD